VLARSGGFSRRRREGGYHVQGLGNFLSRGTNPGPKEMLNKRSVSAEADMKP